MISKETADRAVASVIAALDNNNEALASIIEGQTVAVHCEHCERKLNPKKIVWLELNATTGTYHAEEVPEEDSQGCFPFGAGCAKTILKNGGAW